MNKAEWRRQLFSISLSSHHAVGVTGLTYCPISVPNTEQTCIISTNLLIRISRHFGNWDSSCDRAALWGPFCTTKPRYRQVSFTTWSNSIREICWFGKGGVCFFSPLSSASISSVKVSSRLELSLLREKRIPLLKPRGFPYTWHHIEKPLYVAFVVSYCLWVFGDELHSLAMSFCLGDLKWRPQYSLADIVCSSGYQVCFSCWRALCW